MTPRMTMSINSSVLLVILVGFLLIACLFFLISPEIKNLHSEFELIREHDGESYYVENIGDKLPSSSIPTREFIRSQITNERGNILQIESSYISKDAFTDEVIYDNYNTYFVDKITRKHVDSEFYYVFPTDVQKQDYLLLDPVIEVPTTFVFEESQYIDDLEVYVFSCEILESDFSGAYPELLPVVVFGDQTCKTSIEPITGKTLQFSLSWDIYVIEDGMRLSIDRGTSKTSNFTEEILYHSALHTKQLFHTYDLLILIFSILYFVSAFVIIIYKKNSTKHKKLSIMIDDFKRTEKMKNEFSSMISHELKTPLVPIMGYCDMLKHPNMSSNLTPEQLDIVDHIQKNTVDLQRLIHNVLDVQKLEMNKMTYTMTTFNLKNFLDDAKADLHMLMAEKGIDFTVTSDDVSITSDKSRISQVISNLVKNAVDFVPNKGTIQINAQSTDGTITFSVKDDGIGIPKEKQEHLFDKYYQVDASAGRKHGGTGLGLAICYGIVEGLGGKIWVESEEGKGTTFFFTIPKNQTKIKTS